MSQKPPTSQGQTAGDTMSGIARTGIQWYYMLLSIRYIDTNASQHLRVFVDDIDVYQTKCSDINSEGHHMITDQSNDGPVSLINAAVIDLVRHEGPDLTVRQLGLFWTCYLHPEPQTVRALAATLGMSRVALSHELDRLAAFDLVRRRRDPLDRRSERLQKTATGMTLFREMRQLLSDAAAAPMRHPPRGHDPFADLARVPHPLAVSTSLLA